MASYTKNKHVIKSTFVVESKSYHNNNNNNVKYTVNIMLSTQLIRLSNSVSGISHHNIWTHGGIWSRGDNRTPGSCWRSSAHTAGNDADDTSHQADEGEHTDHNDNNESVMSKNKVNIWI